MSEHPSGEVIIYQRKGASVVERKANIYAEGELSKEATCRDFRQVRIEGGRPMTRSLLAEIDARHRQYECYRDRLLTFREAK